MIREENIVDGYLWRCIECGYSRKNKVRVANHIEAKHIDSEGFNCDLCGKFCSTSNALQIHISRNHPS